MYIYILYTYYISIFIIRYMHIHNTVLFVSKDQKIKV